MRLYTLIFLLSAEQETSSCVTNPTIEFAKGAIELPAASTPSVLVLRYRGVSEVVLLTFLLSTRLRNFEGEQLYTLLFILSTLLRV